MPMRITSGNNALYREYGVHNGATCVVDSWELEAVEREALENTDDAQVVLQCLPKKIIVRLDRQLKQQYPGFPHNCFPLSPVTVYWTLDADDSIDIQRHCAQFQHDDR